MGALSIWHWLIVIGVVFLICYPIGRILKRIGYSAWWALLWILPLVNLIALWVFAYKRWPRDAQASEALR